MKAIVGAKHESADGLQLREIERPTPKDDEVLIRAIIMPTQNRYSYLYALLITLSVYDSMDDGALDWLFSSDWSLTPEAAFGALGWGWQVTLALTPGPGIFYVLARSIKGGRREGYASAAGTAVGGLFHVLAAALGISAVLAALHRRQIRGRCLPHLPRHPRHHR